MNNERTKLDNYYKSLALQQSELESLEKQYRQKFNIRRQLEKTLNLVDNKVHHKKNDLQLIKAVSMMYDV